METVAHSGAGHVGGPLSAMDLLVALYFRVLRIRPDEPDWPERDRFVLSKGHSSVAPLHRDGHARLLPGSRSC